MIDEVPSLSYLTRSFNEFDKEVLELLEREILKDDETYGKVSFVKKLLDSVLLYKRKFHNSSQFVDSIIIKLGAFVSVIGEKPPVREELIGEVRELASKYRPENQNKLEQNRMAHKLLEQPLGIGEALVLSYLISKDERLSKSYSKLVSFYKGLNGSNGDDLTSLFKLIPASIDEESIEYLKDVVEEVSIIPKGENHINTPERVLEEINIGKFTFRPSKNSGWLSYRNYALQSLLGSSGLNKLNNEDKLTLKVIFLGALGNSLELQQRDSFIHPKYYERLAYSYSFLLDLIMENFSNFRFLSREGKHKHLVTELKQIIRVCYGLYLEGREDEEQNDNKNKINEININAEIINSLKSQYDIQKGSFITLCESNEERCLQIASEWRSYLV